MVTKLDFLSHDGLTQINAYLRLPEAEPRAVVQIVHGMEEHVGRYDDFASYLVSCGFAVCAADTLGHGGSVTGKQKLSCIPAEKGADILIEDVHELHKIVSVRLSQEIPYFVFGHSMGSFTVRAYLALYGEGLSGAILCGTGQQPLLVSKLGGLLARAIARVKGEDYKSPFLEGMGAGAYAKRIAEPRTPYDWLSFDEAVVDAYIADPLCAIPFSAGAYAALTELTARIATVGNAAKVPPDLPLLYIAGALDPVGDKGLGVRKAADLLRKTGVRRIELILYEGMRHEILNEPGKQRVYDDVNRWMCALLEEGAGEVATAAEFADVAESATSGEAVTESADVAESAISATAAENTGR